MRRGRGLTARMLTASGLVVLVVAAVFTALLLAIHNLRDASRLAAHSDEVIAVANKLERLVLDTETGARGYVITGQTSFLEPWRAARAAIPGQAAGLERLVADNPAQEAKAKAIATAIDSYLSEWEEPLVKATSSDPEQGKALVASGGGKRRVDAIRAQFDRFLAVERALGKQRDTGASASARRAIAVGAGGLAACVLVLLCLAAYLSRAIVGPVRRIAAAADRAAAGDLSARVPEAGRDEIGILGRSFNAMAASLEQSRDELESQNAELREAQKALEQSNALLAAVMETSPDHIYFKDEASRFIRISRSLAEWFGLSDSEAAIGKSDHDFFSEAHARKALADEQEVMRSGMPAVGIEEKETWADGRETWVSTTKMPLRDADGHVVGTFGISRDVTERERGEEEIRGLNEELEQQTAELEQQTVELEAQQAELESALGNLTEEKERIDLFYRFSERIASETELEPLARTVLTALCDFAGAEIGALYTVDEERRDVPRLVTARGLDPARLPEQLRTGEGLAGRSLAERRPVGASYGDTGLRLPAFGEEVAVQHELNAPLCHGDRALGVVTLARVADRPFSAAEVETIEHLADQAALALSNALAFADTARQVAITRTVLDATPAGIQLVDLEGNTLLANAPMAEILAGIPGLPREGTVAERIPAVAELMSDPAGYRAAMESVVGDPEREARFELELAKSGRSFHLYTTPVRDSAGSPVGRVFAVREVTAEREADRLKSELVATVSHELRTPLASILGFTELLLDRDRDPATRERYLGTIHGEAKRLSALINDFLDLQRIENGGFELATEPFELGDVLSEKADLFSGQSALHTLELVLPAEPLVLHGERDRIAQVVANFLSNAIKYSPAGGRVLVRAEPGESTVRVSVSDEGLGIPADQQEQIFSKFFRVDSSDTREIGGTGLGLALCREIVEAHGGRIGFESVEGEGSTFWFELAVAPLRDGAGPQRVLVVEDDSAAAALLSEYLWEDGYAVEVRTTGEAAVARVAADPPLLVCLDIGLAGELDGWHVLAELKESPSTAHIPVVVCTAGNGHAHAAALGAADFLSKPFTARRLRQVLSRLLPSAHGSVLVVDDDESVRRLVQETVDINGVEIREAADGEEALAEVAERRPDAIVLDLVMPKLDGFGVLERLHNDPATRSIPVVVLTGRQLSLDERSSLQERAVLLLRKNDYSRGELRELIARALGQELLDQVE